MWKSGTDFKSSYLGTLFFFNDIDNAETLFVLFCLNLKLNGVNMKTNKNDFLGARFREKEAKLIRELVELRGESISVFLRRSVLKELGAMDMVNNRAKKALGLEVPKRG